MLRREGPPPSPNEGAKNEDKEQKNEHIFVEQTLLHDGLCRISVCILSDVGCIDTGRVEPPCLGLGRAVIVAASGAIFRIETRRLWLTVRPLDNARQRTGKRKAAYLRYFLLAESGIELCSTTTLFVWYGRTLRSLPLRAV